MVFELKYPSYGMCTCEKEHRLYMSAFKNREYDLENRELTGVFDAIGSINPRMSYSGKYIALPNSQRGIEIVDRTNGYQTVFKTTAHWHKNRVTPLCAWYTKEDLLIFATDKMIAAVHASHPEETRVLFCLDDFESDISKKTGRGYMFIQSFDIVLDEICVVCYRSPDPCIIAEINIQNGNTKITQEYSQMPSPDFIVWDRKNGYYLSKYYQAVFHYPACGSHGEKVSAVKPGYEMAVTNDGLLLAVNSFTFENVVRIYNTKTWKMISEIPLHRPVPSIAFSDEGHYLLISGKKSLLVECMNDELVND